jgi:long-chain fatty acid transport protein
MRRLIVIATVAALARPAMAGGIMVGESGSQAMERGAAFVAKADDPSALWINPAGLAKTTGSVQAYIGSSFIDFDLTFQRTGTYQPTGNTPEPSYVGEPYPEVSNSAGMQVVPSLAAVAHLGSGTSPLRNVAIALGVFGPQGYPNRQFDCDVYENCLVGPAQGPAPNRYDIVDQKALIAFPSVGLAYRVHPRIDIGLRASWGFGSLTARSFVWGLRNDEGNVEKDGDFAVDASDSFIPAFGGGILVRPMDNLEIGVSYASHARMNASGTGTSVLGEDLGVGGVPDMIVPLPAGMGICSQEAGTLSALKACVSTGLPQTVTGGMRWIFRGPNGGERGDVEFDAKWENWSQEPYIRVDVDGQSQATGAYLQPTFIKHGSQDVIALRLGGSWRIAVGGNTMELRGGVSYDTASSPVSWSRLDKDNAARFGTAAGAAFHFGRYTFDAGFAAFFEGARDVAEVQVAPIAGDQTPIDQRKHPDAAQPLFDPNSQFEAPFNAGHYESGYLMAIVGFTAGF